MNIQRAPAAGLLILGKLFVVLGLGLGVALLSIGVVALTLLVEGGGSIAG